MNKEILEEKAQLYALGTLPDDELEAFESQIRSDRETQSLVHEYQKVMERDALPGKEAPSFRVYSTIMEQLEETPAKSSPEIRGKRSALVTIGSWAGWAAAACFAIVFVVKGVAPRAVGSNSDIVLNELGNPRIVAVKTPSEEFAVEDRMLELAGLAEAYWFSREGVPEGQKLEGGSSDSDAFSEGFTIFDKKYNIGFIAVENLPRETPNKSYHVWASFADGSPPVRAGTLPIGDESRGLFFFDLSNLPKGADLEQLSFFVTEEANDDPVSPSEMVVLRDV